MERNTLTVTINRPVTEVFAFVLDPQNTPSWIDFITEEHTSEWPPRDGTIYRNRWEDGEWREFVMSELVDNAQFVLSALDSAYRVRYTVRPAGEDAAELEYDEWVEEGELTDPVAFSVLQKLKTVLESKTN